MPKLDTIQLLRAVAVVGVGLSHTAHELADMLAGRLDGFDDSLFSGDFGVDLFFVISGFVMAYTTRNMLGSPAEAWQFVKRRIIRIVPLYWIMTSLMILVVILLPQQVNTATADWRHWLASYFFIPYMRESDDAVRPVLSLGWTLQYEMYFYALFAVGLLLPLGKRLAVVVAALLAILLATNLGGLGGAAGGFLRHPIVLEFAAGIVICRINCSGWRISRGYGILATAVAFAILVALPAFGARDDELRYLYYGIPGALLVIAAVLTRGDDGRHVNRHLVDIGDASYATYLTHPFVLGAVALVMQRSGLTEALPPVWLIVLYGALVMPMILVTGHLTHRYLDLPVTGWVKRVWSTGPGRSGRAPGVTGEDVLLGRELRQEKT